MVSMETTLSEARQQVEDALKERGLENGRRDSGRTTRVLDQNVPLDAVSVTLNFYESGNVAMMAALEVQTLLREAGKAESEEEFLGFIGGATGALREIDRRIFEIMVFLTSTKGTEAFPFDDPAEPKLVTVEKREDGSQEVTLSGFDDPADEELDEDEDSDDDEFDSFMENGADDGEA